MLWWLDVVRKKLVSLEATYFFGVVVEVKVNRGLEPFSPNKKWQCGRSPIAQAGDLHGQSKLFPNNLARQ